MSVAIQQEGNAEQVDRSLTSGKKRHKCASVTLAGAISAGGGRAEGRSSAPVTGIPILGLGRASARPCALIERLAERFRAQKRELGLAGESA